MCTLAKVENRASRGDFVPRALATRKADLRNTEKHKGSEVPTASKAAPPHPLSTVSEWAATHLAGLLPSGIVLLIEWRGAPFSPTSVHASVRPYAGTGRLP